MIDNTGQSGMDVLLVAAKSVLNSVADQPSNAAIELLKTAVEMTEMGRRYEYPLPRGPADMTKEDIARSLAAHRDAGQNND